ncbi:MAG TPA: ABC transporter ATP-binding protein [Acidimicrobiales bacterium]
MISLLRTYLPRLYPLLVGVVAFQTGQAVFMLYLPRITADIIDKGVIVGDTGYIWSAGAWMLAVTLAQMACMIAGVYFGARTAMALGRHIRRDLFHRVTAFSAREVNQLGAPTLITRITNDVQQIQMMMVMLTTMAVTAPLMAGFGIVMAIREDAGLSWVLIIAVPMFGIPLGLILSRIRPVFTDMANQIDDVNGVLREQITGLRVVRAFVREPVERARFATANDRLTMTTIRQGRLMAVLFPITLLVQNAASIAVVWFGAARIESGATTVGALFAFLGYIVLVLMAVMMGAFAFVMIPRAAVSGGRIKQVLDTEPSVATPAAPVTDVPMTGSVELRAVAFGYPGAEEPVITDISVVAPPGHTTAIIGSTGAGKTTLLNLIPRLVDVTAGTVLVDGVDVRDLALDALWQRIGLVPQKPFLFSGTVAENLSHGKPDATTGEMWEALHVAQAADFVSAMPGGLHAPITQGGSNVSGGQRQRLAIARAIIRKPAVYLFDDAFSSLDLATDARLRAALVPYTANSTVLIVAQRVSTIIDADQILVLEGGRNVGLGTHRDLLDTCSTYAEIVDSQMSAEEAA